MIVMSGFAEDSDSSELKFSTSNGLRGSHEPSRLRERTGSEMKRKKTWIGYSCEESKQFFDWFTDFHRKREYLGQFNMVFKKRCKYATKKIRITVETL
jgi:hypothetical protein